MLVGDAVDTTIEEKINVSVSFLLAARAGYTSTCVRHRGQEKIPTKFNGEQTPLYVLVHVQQSLTCSCKNKEKVR